MQELIQTEIDGKKIHFFRSGEDGAPVVYANMYAETGKAVLEQCERLGCKPFHFVSITNIRWDEELTPWAHEPVVSKDDHFAGGADRYIHCMEQQIIPYIEDQIKPPCRRIIAGYSLGGLFALYAPYVTEAFSALVSASGSVWYPEFLSYVKSHRFLNKPDAVYLSLGDRESRAGNPYLRQAENCMRELYSAYQDEAICSVFELNPGNHYKDADDRLAKGIAWVLEQCGTK